MPGVDNDRSAAHTSRTQSASALGPAAALPGADLIAALPLQLLATGAHGAAGALRTAQIQRLQQTIGNRATRQLIQRTAAPPVVVQRVQTYAQGGKTGVFLVDTASMPAITDDNRAAIQGALRAVMNGNVRVSATNTRKTRLATDQEKQEASDAYNASLKNDHGTPEDAAFRKMITDKADTGATNKQDRQVTGLHNFFATATQTEKDDFVKFLQKPENKSGLTGAVRQGELNETLLTSQTTDAVLRSLGQQSGFESHGTTTSGDAMYYTDYQRETSYPTRHFTFKGTTQDENGMEMQDTHINANTYQEDTTGKRHLTVGNTSHEYHFGTDDSLKSNFDKSHRMSSLHRRNVKHHQQSLARRDDVLAVPATQRGPQKYKTTGGKVLNLNDATDLDEYADIADVHTRKVLTGLKQVGATLKSDGNESESEVEDIDTEDEVDPSADTDDEVEHIRKKRKKNGTT